MDALWFVAGLVAGVVLALVFLMTVVMSDEFWESNDERN